MRADDDKIRERLATAILDRLHIYNFVHVFEEHMPDVNKLMRTSIDEMLQTNTLEHTINFLETMFDKDTGVLSEYTWLKPYCFLYARTQAKRK